MSRLTNAAYGVLTALVAREGVRGSGAAELTLLAEVDRLGSDIRELIADERAMLIAERARATTTRQAAEELGLSASAVGKAVARVRTLEAE